MNTKSDNRISSDNLRRDPPLVAITDLPEPAIEAARLAMAIALAEDGDGIPECIVAAINAWDQPPQIITLQVRLQRACEIAEHAILQWQVWMDAQMNGSSFYEDADDEVSFYEDADDEVNEYRCALRELQTWPVSSSG